jgi:phenylacetate-coenzyme A ligase PaaK-like adenylate-forming protein
LRGNPFQLSELATYLKRHGPCEIEPRVIFSMGSLLDQRSRTLLESVFRAEIFDCYGATEFGCIAWECSAHEGYHINVDTIIFEIVRNGESLGPRERGRIICTGLHSSAMPLIRYDLGDIGVLSDHECSCGRGLPLLETLEGRADDFLVSSRGTLYSPSVIVNEIKSVVGISQFRIIQENETRLSVEIVPDRHFSPKTTREAESTLKKIVGTDLEVKIRIVNEILSDKTGKIRSISSKVNKVF